MIFFSLLLAACEPKATLYQQKIITFGTVVELQIITTDKAQVQRALSAAEKLLRKRHSDWHAWREGELQTLNQSLASAKAVKIPPSLKTLIFKSIEFESKTEGLFNPAIGQLIAAWGFHESQQKDEDLLSRIQKNIPSMHDLIIKQDVISTTNPYLQLDFGGIAKGLAIMELQSLFKSLGFEHYLINAGGDIYSHGNRGNKTWKMGIQNPFGQGAIGVYENSANKNIFTSGNYQRYQQDKQGFRHHIIDPRSGAPSTNITAVTVVHNDALTADVAATALMIAEPELHPKIARQLGISEYLYMTDPNEVWITLAMKRQTVFNNAIKVHIITEKTL